VICGDSAARLGGWVSKVSRPIGRHIIVISETMFQWSDNPTTVSTVKAPEFRQLPISPVSPHRVTMIQHRDRPTRYAKQYKKM